MLRILKSSSDGHTGHISVTCHIVEKSENVTTNGAEETHGIHPDSLQSKYGGNVQYWLRDVHKEMRERHESRKKAADAMQQLSKLEFIDE